VELIDRHAPAALAGWTGDGRVFMLVDIAAEDPGVALAAAVVAPAAAEPARHLVVGFAVDPRWRRRGLGTRLMGELHRTALADGHVLEVTVPAVVGQVFSAAEPARPIVTRLLQGLGFVANPTAAGEGAALFTGYSRAGQSGPGRGGQSDTEANPDGGHAGLAPPGNNVRWLSGGE
jgi:GNAT superfamily N-acetyltransferase